MSQARWATPRAAAGAAWVPHEVRPALRARRRLASLNRSALRFLAAFLRYEVGIQAPDIAARIRATATAPFAADLLALRPRAPPLARFPLPARLAGLQLGLLSAAARRALVTARALRGGATEHLSFLFVFRAGRWLASSPAE